MLGVTSDLLEAQLLVERVGGSQVLHGEAERKGAELHGLVALFIIWWKRVSGESQAHDEGEDDECGDHYDRLHGSSPW